VLVRVPASSANLGPGFDSFAAALGLWLELEVVESGRFSVRTDLDVARDRRNLAVRGFARLHPPDRFTFAIRSEIPLSGGLGSSAAAYVAGLLAARGVTGGREDLLAPATELEGHPDNVAAALEGGVVVCAPGGVARLEPPAGLEAVLLVPRRPVRTAAARAALPERVPLADAAANVGLGATLALGLALGDLELVARGLDDRLHQPYRAHLFPASVALLERARTLGALGATVSGAGPTVLFWSEVGRGEEVAARLAVEAEGWADVHRVAFERHGAHADAGR
jgi:homoserine kinase